MLSPLQSRLRRIIDTIPEAADVAADDEGTAIIHAMKAREKFLKGWWIR